MADEVEKILDKINELEIKLDLALAKGERKKAVSISNEIEALKNKLEELEERPIEKVEETKILGAPRVPRTKMPEEEVNRRFGAFTTRANRKIERANKPSEEDINKAFGAFTTRANRKIERANKPSEEDINKAFGAFTTRANRKIEKEENAMRREGEMDILFPTTEGWEKRKIEGKFLPPTSEESDEAMKEWEERKKTGEGYPKGGPPLPPGKDEKEEKALMKTLKKIKLKGKTHVYTNAIITIAIAAIIAFILPMIFGSDPGVLLISAGIIFLSIEGLFGSGGAGGYAKSVFRTTGFIFIAWGLFLIFGNTPLLKIIPLLVLAFELVTYPMPEYVISDEDRGLQFMRMALGLFLTIIFYLTFQSIMNVNPNLLISFVLLSIAFFIAFPESKSKDEGSLDKLINAFARAGERMGEGLTKAFGGMFGGGLGIIKYLIIGGILLIIILFFVAMFLPTMGNIVRLGLYGVGILVGFAILVVGVSYSAKKNSINGILYGFFGGAGIMLGSLAFAPLPISQGLIGYFLFLVIVTAGILAAAPVVNARPLIGVPIIFLAIMSATIAYPDIMGQATFGVWWPTIDRTIENTFGPLQNAITGPFMTLQRGYACLADPVGCMQNYKPQTSTKETPKAVEITSLEPLGADSIDIPGQTLLVLLDVQNFGKDEADNIIIHPIQPMYSQGTATGESFGKAYIKTNKGWKSNYVIPKLLPNEVREFILNYTFYENASNGDMYLRRGNYVTYGAYISYEYNVSGRLEVDIMDTDYYYKLAKNDKLNRREQITEDTGGPVRLGIAVMKNEMPIPDGQTINTEVPILIYIENQGNGEVYKLDNIIVDLTNLGDDNGYCTLGKNIQNLHQGYLYKKSLGPGDSAKGLCFATLPDINVDQKTYLVTANMTYNYRFYKYDKIPVNFGAMAQCECVNEKDENVKDYLLVYSCGNCTTELCQGAIGSDYKSGNCAGKQKSD